MPIEAVVADANVLLSAIIGRAALRVFTEFEVQVHVTEFNAREVREYLPRLAAKFGLPAELLEIEWKILSIRIHPQEDYNQQYPAAMQYLAERDPEDAHALALARSLGIPLWSNDKDLADCGIECYSTARLLTILEQ